ncbi:hypothetical protein BDK92_7208 [Micromonospora pisi]|uniref:Uncharacterized protein n=1 Tax=Micromonospora pisi TaxID=589240 RepID=A0A495JUQ9_9ACTN|nr:hypothetical protein [Micromonospora pisi]RKR92730.1 hypothetical protein BDK92_7208 [Micromonospora pisi]
MHTEETVAEMLTEPEDGTRLVVQNGDTEFKVIWRDDAEAKNWSPNKTDRWFDAEDSDPMELYQHVKYATAVYPLGEPLAVYGR